MMRKLQHILLFVLVILTGASCTEYFEIDPITEVTEDQLFDEELGFYYAINGLYLELSSEDLYAKTLTYGVLEDLAQAYEDTYERLPDYDYNVYGSSVSSSTEESFKREFNDIWANMYNVIADCNNIIDNLQKTDIVFPNGNDSIILAEALGIRAFLHFDLLRLFGHSVIAGGDELAIPYVDNFGLTRFPRLTVNQVLERVIADLTKSEELLKDLDPILFDVDADISINEGAVGVDELYSDNGFRKNRVYRLNYYSVQSLLARVYLYAGNKTSAYDYATKVIDAAENGDFARKVPDSDNPRGIVTGYTAFGLKMDLSKLETVYNSDFGSCNRILLSNEIDTVYDVTLLSAYTLYEPQQWGGDPNYAEKKPLYDNFVKYVVEKDEYSRLYFTMIGNIGYTMLQKEGPYGTQFGDTYPTYPGENDRRLKMFQLRNLGSGEHKLAFVKFLHYLEDNLPLIKLQELYLIAAEAAPSVAEGLVYLNTHRAGAKLDPYDDTNISSMDALQNEIEKEYKKEFLGDGQIFFYHKRMNHSIIIGTNGTYVPNVDNDIYVLPMPTDQGF